MGGDAHRLEVTFFLDDDPPESPAESEGRTAEDRFADEMLTDDEKEIWERVKERRRREGRSSPLPTLMPVQPGRTRRGMGTGRDPAKPRGERHAWVLKDDRGPLEDRWTWVLRVGD